MLTKKHFVALARVLDDFDDNILKHELVRELSRYLKTQNGRFSPVTFEHACYFSDDK